jgi:uncharacterized lipoprotein YmbA
MMTRALKRLGLVVLAIFATGCSSPQTRHYTLAVYALPLETAITGGPAITVGVGPVRLPEYVDRPEIVLRLSDTRVDLLSFEHWAAPLSQRFAQVLVADMQMQMPYARVIAAPPEMPTPLDVQIEVDVERFDVDQAGTAVLIARYQLRGSGGGAILAAGRAEVMANAPKAGVEGWVTALSEAVARLGRVLVEAVQALPPGARAPR